MNNTGITTKKIYLTLGQITNSNKTSKQIYSCSPRARNLSPTPSCTNPSGIQVVYNHRSFTPETNSRTPKPSETPTKPPARGRSRNKRPPRPQSKPPTEVRFEAPVDNDVKAMCKPYDLNASNAFYPGEKERSRAGSASRIDFIKGSFSQKQMHTPDKSPIKRGLRAHDFEYSIKDLKDKVEDLGAPTAPGFPGRRNKAKSLSRGFSLDKSKLMTDLSKRY